MAGHIADSGNVSWCTPENILKAVRSCFAGVIYTRDGTKEEIEQPIVLDPCSNDQSLVKAKVEYKLPAHDGLSASWNYPTIFVNPPFGRSYMHKKTLNCISQKQYKDLPKEERKEYGVSTIGEWILRCARANIDHGAEVIALVPAAVDTAHWQSTIFNTAGAVCFVKGRIKFVGAAQGAPMACALVYWGEYPSYFMDTHKKLGYVTDIVKPYEDPDYF